MLSYLKENWISSLLCTASVPPVLPCLRAAAPVRSGSVGLGRRGAYQRTPVRQPGSNSALPIPITPCPHLQKGHEFYHPL